MWYPYHHTSSPLHLKELVLFKKDISSTTCSISYLKKVSLNLILRLLLYWITQWYGGINSTLLTINPMGYSYWTSVLNWTIYFSPVSTPLRLQRCPHLQSNWDIPFVYSSSNNFEAADVINLTHPLYPTFVVYLTTIHGQPYQIILLRSSETLTIISRVLPQLRGS